MNEVGGLKEDLEEEGGKVDNILDMYVSGRICILGTA